MARVRRRVTASRAASRTGAVAPPTSSSSRGDLAGGGELLEDRLLLATEELGQHTVDHDRGELHGGLVADTVGELDGLGHRHLLGSADRDQSGDHRVREDVEHPVGLGADEPDLDQIVDRLRRRQLADDVSERRRVDDHQVVVAFTHLVAELADGEDLAHARCGGRHEVERLCERPDPPDHGDPQLELQVLAERRLGVHRHGEEARQDLTLLEAGGRRLVVPGDVALGVDLADEDPLAAQ